MACFVPCVLNGVMLCAGPVQLTIMRNESQSPSAGLVLRCLATGDKSPVVYWIRPPTATDSHILLANVSCIHTTQHFTHATV